MATDLAQTFVVKPEEPAPAVPTFKDVATGITDSVGIARTVRDMAPAGPTEDELREARQKADDARAEQRKRQVSYEESVKPQIEAYKLDAQKYAADAVERLPQRPTTPPQPSRGLQPFLATTKDEPPEATIGKFIQAMTLFATMAGGGKLGARASLSAMTGALEGWKEGNRYKADKAYTAWKDSTETLFRSFDDEMRSYNALMAAERVPLEQKFRALELAAMEHKNAMLAGEFNVTEADKVTAALQKRVDARIDLEKWFAGVVAKKEESDQRHEEKIKQLEEMGRYHIGLLTVKQQITDLQLKQQADAVAAYTPESLTALGQQWALTGKMPSIGMGGKGAALAIRGKVIQAGIEWARAQGIDPQSLPSVRAEVASAQQGLNTLSRQNAAMQASIRRFDGHVDALLELSKKVPRSEMPAINAAIVRGEREFAGSPEAAAYVVQAFEVGMELARVVLPGSAQGDAQTREEARKAISAAMTHEQLLAVTAQLRQNAHRNIHSNRDAEKAVLGVLEAVGAGAGGPRKDEPGAGQPAPGGTIWRLRNIKTGQIRRYEPSPGETEPPAGYEKVP